MLFKGVKRVVLILITFCIQNAYAQLADSSVIITDVKIIGNKKTKNHIILRELSFSVGDVISTKNLKKILEKTKSNITNTSLFNFVSVEPAYFKSKYVTVYITVEERWYFWPIPIFEIEEPNFNTWWLTKNFNRANYGFILNQRNFRGRKESITLGFQKGYTEQFGISYDAPYINKKKTQGLTFSFSYSRNHEVNYNITNNIRDFYRSNSVPIKEEWYSKITYQFRPKIYTRNFLTLKHTKVNIADSVAIFNPDYLTKNQTSSQFFSFVYRLKRDLRTPKSYPLTGYSLDLKFSKDGLGIINNKFNSLRFIMQFKKYWQLAPKFYLAGAIKGSFSATPSPYYLIDGLARGRDLVRGYEFYVINGDHYTIFKSQLKYALLKNKILNIKSASFNAFNKIPLSIYPGIFFDAGYVEAQQNAPNNSLNNTPLYGAGLSVDFATYYDMVFRMEYSINKEMEKGLFLHFIAPI